MKFTSKRAVIKFMLYKLCGYTHEQQIRFFRGICCGAILAVIIFLVMGEVVDKPRNLIRLEVARESGYSKCLMDTVGIIANGGGIDELIAFARASGQTQFATSPTNFYR